MPISRTRSRLPPTRRTSTVSPSTTEISSSAAPLASFRAQPDHVGLGIWQTVVLLKAGRATSPGRLTSSRRRLGVAETARGILCLAAVFRHSAAKGRDQMTLPRASANPTLRDICGMSHGRTNSRNVPPARTSRERPSSRDRPTRLRLDGPASPPGRPRRPARRARSSRRG